MRPQLFAIPLSLLLTAACSGTSGKEDAIRAHVERFATRYFNYDLTGAADCCTQDSRKWISLAASNITEDDLEILKNQEESAMADVTDVRIDHGDTTATATVHVTNFMQTDTIGRQGHIVPSAVFRISVVNTDDKWLVRMACPLRSGT